MLSSMGEVVLALAWAGLVLYLRIAQTVQGWLLVKSRPVLLEQKTSGNDWIVHVASPKISPPC